MDLFLIAGRQNVMPYFEPPKEKENLFPCVSRIQLARSIQMQEYLAACVEAGKVPTKEGFEQFRILRYVPRGVA